MEVTVKLWGRGVVPRGTKLGAEIGGSRRLRVHTNQFIVSRIDARNGAFGLIPDELDNAIVSNDFPTFTPDHKLLLPEYLGWLSKTPKFVADCKAASEGTTNRVRMKAKLFDRIKIALPPLEDQRRIVTKVEALASRIEEANHLRQSVLDDAQAMLHSAFSQVIKGAVYRPLEKVAPIVRRPVEVRPDGEYPELGVRSFGNGTFHKPALSGHDVGSKKLFHMESGDIVFSNVFAWEGAIAVVQQEDEGRVASHRFITCVPNEGDATANFLRFFFLTREGLEKIGEASPGGAGRNRTLGLKKLEKIKVPIPAIEKQLRFDKLQAMVTEIKNAQTSNQVELEALLPAILDKAFEGDL